MKLYIKEKVFSWGDKFTVKDVSKPEAPAILRLYP